MFLTSLYFAIANFWQTTETYSPQTFSVTAAVVAPAVVICLNSLLSSGTRTFRSHNVVSSQILLWHPLSALCFFSRYAAYIVNTYPLFFQHNLGRFCRKGNSCQGQSRHRLCGFPQQCEYHERAQTSFA